MAFFDNMIGKISHTAHSTAQKAKDLAEITKLNSAVSDEERKITNSYYQIGKLYVALHADSYEADFETLISAINESESKIAAAKAQIQKIKGVIKCEKCGTEHAPGAAFCISCGSPMPKIAASDENLIKCIGCGEMISAKNRFCTSCGKSIAESLKYYEAENDNEKADLAGDTEAQGETPSNLCPVCKSAINDEMTFCTGCGSKLK